VSHVLTLEPTILWPGEEDIDGFHVVCTCGWKSDPFADTDIAGGRDALAAALEHERQVTR
jgi:hypothetical protein